MAIWLSDLSSLLWNVGEKDGGEPDDAELLRLSKRLVENAVLKAVQQYLEETQNKKQPGEGSSVKTGEAERNGNDSDHNRKWGRNTGSRCAVESIPAPFCWVQGLTCSVLFVSCPIRGDCLLLFMTDVFAFLEHNRRERVLALAEEINLWKKNGPRFMCPQLCTRERGDFGLCLLDSD